MLEREDDGKITWYLIIPHGGPFAAAQKKRLDSPEIFQQFLMAAEGTPEHRQIVCRLVQQDPNVVANKVLAYKHLKTARNGGALTSTPNPTDGPSQGAQAAASTVELVNQLNDIHGPAEHLTGSHEGHVYINPENPDQYFHLNMGRATSWAKAIRKNPRVTLLVPPKSDQFQYKTKGDEPPPPPPPPPSVQIPVANPFNFPAMFFNPTNMPTTSMNMPTANAPRTPDPPARAVSPTTPPHDIGNMDDFFRFSHVDPNSPEVHDGMSTLGITHWTMFKLFTAAELHEKGIPEGPARSIAYSAKKYTHHLMRGSRTQ
ncbi:hypothetical protein PTTG_07587 [Puccinia triticina 1-1 BBBD Race 1]|uniref:Uncharacterized protein n=1 Tax=Puccinia triticina (isolate 1-1 / race 1 (BBBD)) TaxID=630390 RepID=A0A180G6Q5_PUCT1|nr:hypothetical protein PTTG_07587 [Puccinia triticina 1-1 BBBD Race 1]